MKLRIVLAALAITTAVTAAHASDEDVVRALYSDVFSKAVSSSLVETGNKILAPNWQSMGDYLGKAKTREELYAQFAGVNKAVPNLHVEVKEIIHDGDRYIVRGEMTGTPTGDFFGVKPSGKSFDVMNIDVHTLKNGQIVTTYHIEDWAGALQQLSAK